MQQDNENKKYAYSRKNLFFYRIDQLRILIEDDIKMEVLSESTFYPIPNAAAWYQGSRSVRGTILPVINMHFLLGITKATAIASRQWLLKLDHPLFSPIIVAIDSLPTQLDLSTLSDNAINTNAHYPHWIESSAQKNNTIFLFADHYTLLEALINNNEDKLLLSSADYFHKKKHK